VARRDEINSAVGELEAFLDELERAGGADSSAIVRFALYRVAHRRLVMAGFLDTIRWAQPPFPEEGDRESRP
jgi:hypothetical protein